ncbi:hypothetical protein CGCSCA5_v001232 [Colletotrichum siamense]|nr:hypothetical protein CGCSCA5_v001232 [Colletotrichum siamense]KAF4876207.1 hypothetical protein CGCSCA1_v004725 [Colletotrichum siamense]
MTTLPMTDIEAGRVHSNTSPPSLPPKGHKSSLKLPSWAFGQWLSRPAGHSSPGGSSKNTSGDYFYPDDIGRYREGLPRLAAQQVYYENFAIYRRFGYLSQRCLNEDQIRLNALEEHLFKLEHGLADNGVPAFDTQVGSSSGREYNRFPLTVSGTIQEIGSLLPKYHQMLLNNQALKSLHEVRYDEYCNIARKIKADGYLSKDEMAYLRHHSDFVNTGTDPLWLTFESWLYKLPNFLLVPLLEDRGTTKEENAFFLSTPLVRFLFRTLFIWFYAFILLIPVILFSLVQDISRAATVGLLALFTILFTASMALHSSKADNMLLGVCAYAAVLVAFLANV